MEIKGYSLENARYLFLLFILFSACSNGAIFEEEKTIPNGIWTYENQLTFDFQIEDTLAIYSLFLDIVHEKEYNYQNLYTNLYTTFPNGEEIKELASFELASNTGIWLGRCNSRDCELSIPIQQTAYFDQAGAYQLKIEQFMRQDSIPGVKSFKFRIQDTGQSRNNNSN